MEPVLNPSQRLLRGRPELKSAQRPLLRLLVAGFVLLSLACGPCNLVSRDLPAPPARVVVSAEAATQLRSRVESTLSGQPGQQFILRMSDVEVTSLLNSELSKYSESPVANPVVWFTKGKIYATGSLVNVLPISADFYLVAAPHVQDGKLSISIEEFSAGALPLPRKTLETVSQSLNQTIDELQLEVVITALEVLEGEAIVQGVRK
jgi:hypothetical protein